jgi:hypothetical protein
MAKDTQSPYFSTTLTEAEQNYDIYDLEYLAIVKACRNWRPFIAGSPAQDHCAYRSCKFAILATTPQDKLKNSLGSSNSLLFVNKPRDCDGE